MNTETILQDIEKLMCKKCKIRYNYFLENLEFPVNNNNESYPMVTYKMVSTILVVSAISAIGVYIYRKL
jgi:hypothetical protein